MDRRLKIYRDQNVHDSDNTVQSFFSKALSSINRGAPISDNVKVASTFHEGDAELLHQIQSFIEVNGKPCCLNLITERDNKFLKNLEKQAHPKSEEGESREDEDGDAGDVDDLAIIIRHEEEEARKREFIRKEKVVKDFEDEEKRRSKEIMDLAKMELSNSRRETFLTLALSRSANT